MKPVEQSNSSRSRNWWKTAFLMEIAVGAGGEVQWSCARNRTAQHQRIDAGDQLGRDEPWSWSGCCMPITLRNKKKSRSRHLALEMKGKVPMSPRCLRGADGRCPVYPQVR